MDKPVDPNAIPFHEHVCVECKESMRHWRKGGCDLPREIKCDTCTAPPKSREIDGVLVADVTGELDAALEDVGTDC